MFVLNTVALAPPAPEIVSPSANVPVTEVNNKLFLNSIAGDGDAS